MNVEIVTNILPERAEIGCIIGRFQAPVLHEGHLDVIDQVLSRHPRVILFLGQSPHICTKKNPFPYHIRRRMIEERFSGVEVHCLPDVGDDSKWSSILDTMVSSLVGPEMNVVLYGSRDSFIKSYKGKYPTVELKAKTNISASDIRKRIGIKHSLSEEARTGVVWALQQQYDKVVPCVDVAIYCSQTDRYLFIKKPGDDYLRFCGGHAEPTIDTYELDAIKEANEETGLIVANLQYICSAKIRDWRWEQEHDKVKTVFYHAIASSIQQTAKAGDDVKGGSVVWSDLYSITNDMIVPAHVVLLEALKKWDTSTFRRIKP